MRFTKLQTQPAKSQLSGYLSALLGLILAVTFLQPVNAVQESANTMPDSQETVNQSAAVNVDTVNINTADAETLALALDGVGLTRALDIIAYREEYGEFKNVEQIQQVRGIGIATFARNRTRMRVSDVE